MSGYNKIITHHKVTRQELDAVTQLIWESDLEHETEAESCEEDPTFGFIYHIGFPPDWEAPRAFLDEETSTMIPALGFIVDDEPCGFGECLWGINPATKNPEAEGV